jgi:hypothetical protein
MPGYHADLDAMLATRAALMSTVDTLAVALEGGAWASLGPGRLPAVTTALIEDAKAELDRLRDAVTEHADLVDAAARQYADTDRAAAERLARRAGEPG